MTTEQRDLQRQTQMATNNGKKDLIDKLLERLQGPLYGAQQYKKLVHEFGTQNEYEQAMQCVALIEAAIFRLEMCQKEIGPTSSELKWKM